MAAAGFCGISRRVDVIVTPGGERVVCETKGVRRLGCDWHTELARISDDVQAIGCAFCSQALGSYAVTAVCDNIAKKGRT